MPHFLATALRAVNEGEVYRFLTKPCIPEELLQAVHQGLHYQKLLDQARRLLTEVRQARGVIDQLEQDHPGITKIQRTQTGAIEIPDEECSIDEILAMVAD